jgi:hypothetical protein
LLPKWIVVQAEGDGLKKGVLGRECRFVLCVKDHLGEPRLAGHSDVIRVMVQAPDSQKVYFLINLTRFPLFNIP